MTDPRTIATDYRRDPHHLCTEGMTMTGQLRSCPICRVAGAEVFARGDLYVVSCENDDCPFTVEIYGIDERDAVRNWNTRAATLSGNAGERAEDRVKQLAARLIGYVQARPDYSFDLLLAHVSESLATFGYNEILNHRNAAAPPQPAPDLHKALPIGCICPPTSEKTCQSPTCPRKNHLSATGAEFAPAERGGN